MRLLLDTDVVLDFLLARGPFAISARNLFELNAQKKVEACISTITPVNIFYVARKLLSREVRFKMLRELFSQVEVCSVSQEDLARALDLGFLDYEDAAQHACAEAAGVDAIITRNLKDYVNASLQVYSPPSFLENFGNEA